MAKKILTKGIIDRFEGDFAVVEHGGRKHFDLPKEMLPEGVQEGDSIKIEVTIDEAETEKRRQEIEELAQKLFINK